MQQILEFPVNPLCTFDTFVTCDGNAAGLQFARRLADQQDPENLLYLHGPSGSGKTHLLRAIGHALTGAGTIPLISCGTLRAVDDLLSAASGAAVLLVDDLHRLPDDQCMRSGLWQLFNDFYSSGRIIAMAGLHPPRELPLLDDHLVSRLLWGLVARVDASDDHSRRMILLKVADDLHVRVSDDVIDFILMTTSREVGELISAFEALYRLSMQTKRKITLALAREARELHPAGSVR